jgi:hypothetical protein
MSADARSDPGAADVCPACGGTGTLVMDMSWPGWARERPLRAVSRCGACKGSGRPSPLEGGLATALLVMRRTALIGRKPMQDVERKCGHA